MVATIALVAVFTTETEYPADSAEKLSEDGSLTASMVSCSSMFCQRPLSIHTGMPSTSAIWRWLAGGG